LYIVAFSIKIFSIPVKNVFLNQISICMKFVQLSFVIGLVALVVTATLPSCKKTDLSDGRDTVRGIWGTVACYDENGNKESDNSDIYINVRCVDTVGSDLNNILDTTYTITPNLKGQWELVKPCAGWYFLEFSKSGYCKNMIYAHHYDTSKADTLETVYLAKRSQGAVEIDSVTLNESVLSIYRTIYFTKGSTYSLSTWYFFGKDESVSDENYEYSYVSGVSTGSTTHQTVVRKAIDKLLEAGFKEGETVYVRAYCDNARAVSYQVDGDKWLYPNLLEGSKVFSFVIPESDEE